MRPQIQLVGLTKRSISNCKQELLLFFFWQWRNVRSNGFELECQASIISF